MASKKPAASKLSLRTLLDRLPHLDQTAATFRSLLLNGLLIVVIGLSLPILYRELTRNSVFIAPIAVPADIAGLGLTDEVVAERLWDSWNALNKEVAVAKGTREFLPNSQRVEFSIPDSGISLDSFIHHLRSYFGLIESSVSGEMVCGDEPCTVEKAALRLRVIDEASSVIQMPPRGDMAEDQYWKRAMAEVLLRVDPVRGILALRLVNAGVEGNDDRAVAELLKLVRSEHPEMNWAESYAGTILYETGQRDAALQHFQNVVSRDPDFIFALRLKAQALFAGEQFAEAREAINAALAKAPQDEPSLILLGEIATSQGDHKAAGTAFDAAEKLNSNNVAVHFGRGRLFFNQNNIVAARAQFRKAITIDPDHADARTLLVLASIALRDDKEALVNQKALVRLQPENMQHLLRLAELNERLGNLDEAQGALEKARSALESGAEWQFRQASVFRKSGRSGDALAAFRKAFAIDPQYPGLLMAIGDTEMDLKHFDEARQAYRQFIDHAPDDPLAAVAGAKIRLMESGK